MTRLILVRHGQTIWNKEGRAQGAKDIPLSEQGKVQGEYLAKKLLQENIDYIYSSHLARAYDTAKIFAKLVNKPIHIMEEIKEMNFGLWEGLTMNEIELKYKECYSNWKTTPHLAKIPGGETLELVQKRAIKATMDIVEKHRNKNILLISHGVTIKTIIFGLLDIDLSNYIKIRQDNTAINIIDFKENYNVLVRLNDSCHLSNSKNNEVLYER